MQYRTRPRIISDVLSTVRSSGSQEGTSISWLMRSCNLSYSVAVSLLSDLVGAGLIIESKGDGTTRYTLSERGSAFLQKYKQLQDFVQSYGLRL